MRSSRVSLVTVRPGRTSAHNLLRTNSATGPLFFAAASAWGCSMFAEVNTSALAPPAISSFNSPEAPNFACTLKGEDFSNAWLTSVSAPRRQENHIRCSRWRHEQTCHRGNQRQPVLQHGHSTDRKFAEGVVTAILRYCSRQGVHGCQPNGGG